MSYQLTIYEILGALEDAEHPDAVKYNRLVQDVAQDAGNALAATVGCKAGQAISTCVPFYPAKPGDPIPDALEGFDNEEEWGAEHVVA